MESTASLYNRLGGRGKLDILLRNFYASLRLHPVLGPIFESHITDWPIHLHAVADFWSLQTGGPPTYRGRLLAAHAPLGLTTRHFEFWLAQWQQSCAVHFERPIADEMIALAEALAGRMRAALE